MANNRIGETNFSESGPSNHSIPHSVFHGLNTSPNLFTNQGGSAFDFRELEEAIALQGVRIGHDEALYTARPAATLEMFPPWPMRFQQTNRGSSRSGGESTDSGSAVNAIDPESPIRSRGRASTDQQALNQNHMLQQPQQTEMTNESSGTRPPHNESLLEKRQGGTKSEKVLDAKALRRLAQNREAARKSRLRKKAYVEQLESSRIKLSQLEQDLQRARGQGLFSAGAGGAPATISSGLLSFNKIGAAIFDMEHARWLEDDHRRMSELRTALQARLSDGDLRVIVDGYINHYDEIFRLKGAAAKSDVFHLITGMWTTPAERCFLWMGGFRPSELMKMLIPQLDPLTEQQLMGIYSLQQSSQQAEEALSQGLEQLQQSLADTIAGGTTTTTTTTTTATGRMHQMAIALDKLSNLEGLVCQAENLRQQTLHQLRRILTVRQAARCFLVIGEYYARLRALSSLWASRPRDQTLMNEDGSCQASTDLQIVQPPLSHYSTFFDPDRPH